MPNENPPKAGKKTVTVPIKVSQDIKDELKVICGDEDRPLGYIARELMLRGLVAYRRDGSLKVTKAELSETLLPLKHELGSTGTMPIPRRLAFKPKKEQNRKSK